MYVVYENPMPMVADAPSSYEGQTGFDFITEVPTTWDETSFVVGRRAGRVYRRRATQGQGLVPGRDYELDAAQIDVPLAFLKSGDFDATLYVDGYHGRIAAQCHYETAATSQR